MLPVLFSSAAEGELRAEAQRSRRAGKGVPPLRAKAAYSRTTARLRGGRAGHAPGRLLRARPSHDGCPPRTTSPLSAHAGPAPAHPAWGKGSSGHAPTTSASPAPPHLPGHASETGRLSGPAHAGPRPRCGAGLVPKERAMPVRRDSVLLTGHPTGERQPGPRQSASGSPLPLRPPAGSSSACSACRRQARARLLQLLPGAVPGEAPSGAAGGPVAAAAARGGLAGTCSAGAPGDGGLAGLAGLALSAGDVLTGLARAAGCWRAGERRRRAGTADCSRRGLGWLWRRGRWRRQETRAEACRAHASTSAGGGLAPGWEVAQRAARPRPKPC